LVNSLKTLKHTIANGFNFLLGLKTGKQKVGGWGEKSFYIDAFIADFQAKKKKVYKRLLLYGDPTFINVC
jgi:hypothetical protein